MLNEKSLSFFFLINVLFNTIFGVRFLLNGNPMSKVEFNSIEIFHVLESARFFQPFHYEFHT